MLVSRSVPVIAGKPDPSRYLLVKFSIFLYVRI